LMYYKLAYGYGNLVCLFDSYKNSHEKKNHNFNNDM